MAREDKVYPLLGVRISGLLTLLLLLFLVISPLDPLASALRLDDLDADGPAVAWLGLIACLVFALATRGAYSAVTRRVILYFGFAALLFTLGYFRQPHVMNEFFAERAAAARASPGVSAEWVKAYADLSRAMNVLNRDYWHAYVLWGMGGLLVLEILLILTLRRSLLPPWSADVWRGGDS